MENLISKLGAAVLLLVPQVNNSYATSTPYYNKSISRQIEFPAYDFPLEIFEPTPEIPLKLQNPKNLEDILPENK